MVRIIESVLAGGPHLTTPKKLGSPGLDFETWESLELKVFKTKCGRLRFVVPRSENPDLGHPIIFG